MPVILVAENDKASKEKTREYLELVQKTNDKQMILAEDNALMITSFLYEKSQNPPCKMECATTDIPGTDSHL